MHDRHDIIETMTSVDLQYQKLLSAHSNSELSEIVSQIRPRPQQKSPDLSLSFSQIFGELHSAPFVMGETKHANKMPRPKPSFFF